MTSKKPIVYLAGPIFKKTDTEAKDWRAEATTWLNGRGIDVADPMVRDYRGKEYEHTPDIVEGDKQDILRCATVLVNATTPSWGTAMEVLFAWENKIPVYAFVGHQQASPWLRYHATVTDHLGSACVFIRGSLFPAPRPNQ